MVDGITVIEIAGTLVHRGAWIGQSSGLTSYEGIAAQLQAAIADPAIRGIALDIDSFGGEVAGAFDLADRIRAARAQKPVQAFVADHALSAAYVLASQADRITLPRTGAVGSIGVVAMHSDMSGALDQKGIAVTLIHAGARKVDANPYPASALMFASFGGDPGQGLRVVGPTLAQAGAFGNLSGVYLYVTLATALPLHMALAEAAMRQRGARHLPLALIAGPALAILALQVFLLTLASRLLMQAL